MPIKTYPKVTINQLRVGDKVTTWHTPQIRPSGEVAKIDKRVKRADVILTSGEVVKNLELTGTAIVERIVQTEEEKAAERREALLWAIDRAEKDAAEDLAEQQQKVATLLAAGERLDHWKLESLLKAQATAAIWMKVAHVHLIHARRTSEEVEEMKARWGGLHDDEVRGTMTRLEAFDRVVEITRTWLVEQHAFLNRSTSVTSNLMEDVERQAAADFLRHHSYGWF